MRSHGRSRCAITILGSTALSSYNPGVIPQRRHAVYTDIAEAHGTQRNETRPTFNGSKISPSNASIRDPTMAAARRADRGLYTSFRRIYTGVYQCLQPVGLIKHRRSRCSTEGCGWSAIETDAEIATIIVVVGSISLAWQLKNTRRRRSVKSCPHGQFVEYKKNSIRYYLALVIKSYKYCSCVKGTRVDLRLKNTTVVVLILACVF